MLTATAPQMVSMKVISSGKSPGVVVMRDATPMMRARANERKNRRSPGISGGVNSVRLWLVRLDELRNLRTSE